MVIVRCDESDFEALAGIWERSVRDTHDFLTAEDFNEIKAALIPEYFPSVSLYAITDRDIFTGFIGLSTDTVEMLFIDSSHRNMGYGSALINFAKQQGVTKVDVNEQNAAALAFYKAQGFKITGRDETDEAGRPYPTLHLSL